LFEAAIDSRPLRRAVPGCQLVLQFRNRSIHKSWALRRNRRRD
jgi:hypothetical protein